jgi:hypothetical protein
LLQFYGCSKIAADSKDIIVGNAVLSGNTFSHTGIQLALELRKGGEDGEDQFSLPGASCRLPDWHAQREIRAILNATFLR